MIKSLNISIIEPPASALFFLKRRVLVEKTIPRISNNFDNTSDKYINLIKDTKAYPGNKIWVIKENLDVEVYTINRIIRQDTNGIVFFLTEKERQIIYIFHLKFSLNV